MRCGSQWQIGSSAPPGSEPRAWRESSQSFGALLPEHEACNVDRDATDDEDWEEVIRTPSPRNPDQQKSRVWIKRRQKGNEVYILCVSAGRQEKDRAIRESHEQRLKKDLERLQARIAKGQLTEAKKIHQVIGRLRERYPRVTRYYRMDYDAERKTLTWQEDEEKKAIAAKLDGGYVLKTDRQDLSADEIWRPISC